MDEKTNPAEGPTVNVENALEKYLELFNSDYHFFQFYIAENGVLEWFGKTIKGKLKIHEFLRTEVCSQYDHLFFDSARTCDAVETKSVHIQTKQLPTEEEMISTVDLNNSSFIDDASKQDLHTPITKVLETSIEERNGSITPPSAPKRFKHDTECDLNQSIPPLLNIDDYFDRKDTNSRSFALRPEPCPKITSQPAVTLTDKNSAPKYSELKYFESTGILRSCTQPEHRSFRNSSSQNVNGTWDRETKILVSYRIRLHDNDIQFALIIYQNVHQYSLLSKRNLMSEFMAVSTRNSVEAKGENSKTSTPEVKRKLGRRLRLF